MPTNHDETLQVRYAREHEAFERMQSERKAFEEWLGVKPCGAAHDLAFAAWKARAAIAESRQVDPSHG